MCRIGLLWLAIIVSVWNRAQADSYAPFRNFRNVDATGTFYLVITKRDGNPDDPGRGTSVDFTLAKCRPGSEPVTFEEDAWFGYDGVTPNPNVAVREGDTVLCQGQLDRCPAFLLISTTGLGFVGLDVRGYNYGDFNNPDAFVFVAANGKVEHRKAIRSLFPNTLSFLHTAGGIFWCGGGWIDEARSEVVVVGAREDEGDLVRPRQFCVVELKSGNVRRASVDVLTTALKERNVGAASLALDLVAELQCKEAREHLPWFLSQDQPLESRLRAAVALGVLGDRQGAEVISTAALEGGPSQNYSLQYLPVVLGDEAAPILCDAVRRHGRSASYATFGMRQVGDAAAIEALTPMLRDEACPDGQDFAIECLSEKGAAAAAAVPDLMPFLVRMPKTEKPLWTQTLTLIALARIGQPAAQAIPILKELKVRNDARILALKANSEKHPIDASYDEELFDAEYHGEKLREALNRIQVDP